MPSHDFVKITGASRRVAFRWLLALAALVVVTAVMIPLRGRLDKAHVTLGFLLLVLGASAVGGRTLGLAMAGGAFLAFNYFFLFPHGTLVVTDPLDWLVLVAFLITSVVAAQLLHRAVTTAEAATARALEVDRLASLGAETMSAPGADEALLAIASVIRSSLDVDQGDVFMRRADGKSSRVATSTRPDHMALEPSAEALSLIAWIGERGKGGVELLDGTVRLSPTSGGEGERSALHRLTRPDIRALLVPLRVRDEPVGVLRLACADGVAFSAEQFRLLSALTYYAALGVERVRLEQNAERAEAERRVESMRTSLLMAVSHDLRTPLTTIKAIAHGIANGAEPNQATIIEAEADRLDELVADLLDLSRIHAGALQPNLAINTADELIGAALQRAQGALQHHAVRSVLPPGELLAGRFDFTLALRVVVNLLENAAKYSPDGSTIELQARRSGSTIEFLVLDCGAGIPEGEAERIFEPFYRPTGTTPDVRGSGLGLSIARGLAQAQHGALRYEPRPGGGSAFVFQVPAVDLVPEPDALGG